MITKALLYCTKNKPYLEKVSIDFEGSYYATCSIAGKTFLNGKVVAVCDIEVEEIRPLMCSNFYHDELGLTTKQLNEYLNYKNGYAIYIKNLKVFDEPMELGTDEYHAVVGRCLTLPKKAPQNMCGVSAYNLVNGVYISMPSYVLISIQPQWLVKILNGEKTIEVRKKVLKEMLK